MPLRDFQCPAGHLTEELLFGDQDHGNTRTEDKVCMFLTKDGPTLDDREYCGEIAKRLDMPSRIGAPQFITGCGGFHKPTK